MIKWIASFFVAMILIGAISVVADDYGIDINKAGTQIVEISKGVYKKIVVSDEKVDLNKLKQKQKELADKINKINNEKNNMCDALSHDELIRICIENQPDYNYAEIQNEYNDINHKIKYYDKKNKDKIKKYK